MLRLLFVLAVTSLALAAPHEELVEKRGLPKYHVVLGPMTWFEARDACKAVPTCKLAEPKSLAQMNEIMNVFVPGFNWIGITDLLVSDTFAYDSSNSPIVYENWDANEPNNENGTEDCTEIWKFDGTWNDVNCSLARGNAICECPTNGPIGDPHMRTFDGRAYTFQGIGWYYLFKDCTENPRFEVTTKFERREDSTPDQIKTRTIAINITVGNQYAIIDGLDVTTGSTGGMVTDAKRITIQEEEKNINCTSLRRTRHSLLTGL
ncbi:uncharacterized protein LOC102803968 [Saccoglossus kowalevskii]|uniref:P-selectin-like isoform X1 n=1 Tax=Saccoglossus kowalevskii TaxID=10224 RepID=A0ABM0MAY3_SACKO|nr:PREDICTED: P-selectin-like isoform X1 [Saccoglossus kowalevskii]XP_006817174.1 PREDICTED: P-selectin-like isoform X2 [Saccoglossus kowalevskii]